MTLPTLTSQRFNTDPGLRITVQVPEPNLPGIIAAIRVADPLTYGDYDSVTYRSAPGVQQFRSLGTGRNAATEAVAEVPCVELSVFLSDADAHAPKVIEAIYAAHPYEEPVVFAQPCLRTRHIRGLDEDNPNRFWNAPPADWVPEPHR